MVLIHEAEEIPAYAQIDGQLGSDLPIVVDIHAVVVLSVIGRITVGSVNLGCTPLPTRTHSCPARWRLCCISRSDGRQQERSPPRVALVVLAFERAITWYFREVSVVIEFSARPRGLQRGEVNVLPLHTQLKGMLPVNLGEIVGELGSGSDFIRGQEVVASQG